MGEPATRVPPSTRARVALLVLLAAVTVGACLVHGENEEHAMVAIVLALLASSPALVWFTIEPEPSVPPSPSTRIGALLRFPFLPGGASGVAYFLLVFVVVIGLYLVWLRTLSSRGVWLADDDPVQLCFGALYASVYVLLPVGLLSPFLRSDAMRFVAALACFASYRVLEYALPEGAREPDGLTELGTPGRMIRTVAADGELIHYAHNDLAVLAALAGLGVLLNVPRVVWRWWGWRRARPPSPGAGARQESVISSASS